MFEWLKEHDRLSRARDVAAYRIVGALQAHLDDHARFGTPLDPVRLREYLNEYDAADKALNEFHARTKREVNPNA